MRYSKEHAAEVRRRLLRQGGKHVKERGLNGAGVDGIAGSAGLTGAALYRHFRSKEAFLIEMLGDEIERNTIALLAAHDALEGVLAAYLSPAHVQSPQAGCPLPSLVADVGRGESALQEALSSSLSAVEERVAALLDEPDKALGVIAAALGAVSLARAMPDAERAQAVLDATRAMILAGVSSAG